MTKIVIPPIKLEIRESSIANAGRGVFATQAIKVGEVIERSPIIFLSGEAKALKSSGLYNYCFLSEDKESVAIALGYGSIYNHSYEPNATYEKHFEDELVIFKAIKDISADEEVTVNYNYGDPSNKSKLWIPSIKPFEA